MIESILEIDKFFFSIINGQWYNGFLDQLLPFIRNKYFWIPLYIFIISFVLLNFRKKGLWILLGLIIVVVLSDQISSSIIKPYFDRLRPCNDPSLLDSVRLLVNCGGGKSFTSSHATNHFAVATFLGFVSRPYFYVVSILLLLWAAAISYAQVYVGVHFPLDIFCGGMLGMGIGFIIYRLMKRRLHTIDAFY